MKLEITSERGVHAASRPIAIDRPNSPATPVFAPLRHRAVIRARRRRRGFGGAVVTDFTCQEIALNTI